MADVGIKLFHQSPLLALRQRPGSLQQFPLQQAGWIPHFRIGKTGEVKPGGLDEFEQTLQAVTGFLGVQIHVREVRIGSAIDRLAFAVMTGQSVVFRQALEQIPPKPQSLTARSHTEQIEGLLGAMDFPTSGSAYRKMQQPIPGQQIRKG